MPMKPAPRQASRPFKENWISNETSAAESGCCASGGSLYVLRRKLRVRREFPDHLRQVNVGGGHSSAVTWLIRFGRLDFGRAGPSLPGAAVQAAELQRSRLRRRLFLPARSRLVPLAAGWLFPQPAGFPFPQSVRWPPSAQAEPGAHPWPWKSLDAQLRLPGRSGRRPITRRGRGCPGRMKLRALATIPSTMPAIRFLFRRFQIVARERIDILLAVITQHRGQLRKVGIALDQAPPLLLVVAIEATSGRLGPEDVAQRLTEDPRLFWTGDRGYFHGLVGARVGGCCRPSAPCAAFARRPAAISGRRPS